MSNDAPVATYRTAAHLVWVAAILGALIALPMLYAAVAVEAGTTGHALTRWIAFAIGVALLAFAYTLAKVRICVFDDRIERVGAFDLCTLPARDIAGFRDASAKDYIRLIPDAPHLLPMRVPRAIRQCADRVPWIDKLVDLDEADRHALDRAVLSNPRFGATEGDRLAFLKKAKRRILALTLAGVAAVAWALIWPVPRALVVAVLALIPLLSVAVALQARPAIRVEESDRRRGKIDLLLALTAPSVMLMVMAQQAAVIDRPSVALFAAGAAIACALAWLDPLLHRRWAKLVVLAGVGFCYADGVTIEANILLDSAAPSRQERTIHEKYVTGGQSLTHMFVLRPWVDGEAERDIKVPRELYETLAVGDRICLDIHQGALGLRWYEVRLCK